MEQYIAIDFGAVSTKVAVWSEGSVELIRLGVNDYSIPTVVCIINENDADENQDVYYKNYWWAVGEKAINQKKLHPACYAERFKSNLDKADVFDGPLNICYVDLVTVVFKYIIKNGLDIPELCGNRHFALTVPVGTTQYSKRWQTMKDAAMNAGLVTNENCNTNLTMVHESVAAGYCFKEEFELEELSQGHKTCAIFDFGGSTLDCAYFTIDDGLVSLYSPIPEICTSSLSSGGLYMNEVIIKDIVKKCHLESKIESSKHIKDLKVEEQGKLFQLSYDVTSTAEIIKKDYRVNLDCPYEIEYGCNYYSTDKDYIDNLLKPIVTRASKCLRYLVRDNPLDVIIPVGGSSLLPIVEDVLREEFYDTKILRPGNVEERAEASKYFYAVCIGAVNFLTNRIDDSSTNLENGVFEAQEKLSNNCVNDKLTQNDRVAPNNEDLAFQKILKDLNNKLNF